MKCLKNHLVSTLLNDIPSLAKYVQLGTISMVLEFTEQSGLHLWESNQGTWIGLA